MLRFFTCVSAVQGVSASHQYVKVFILTDRHTLLLLPVVGGLPMYNVHCSPSMRTIGIVGSVTHYEN